MSQLVFAYQAVPAVPNGVPSTEAPSGTAAPMDASPFGGWGMLLMFLPMLLLIFWQSRSQQKKSEAAVADLKKGDRCVTSSGLVGRLVEIDARYAKLEVAPNIRLTVLRSSLAGRDTEDPAKSAPETNKDEQK